MPAPRQHRLRSCLFPHPYNEVGGLQWILHKLPSRRVSEEPAIYWARPLWVLDSLRSQLRIESMRPQHLLSFQGLPLHIPSPWEAHYLLSFLMSTTLGPFSLLSKNKGFPKAFAQVPTLQM